MKYKNYLKNKNLSNITINIYLRHYQYWNKYLGDKKPNKTLFVRYLKNYSKNHKPRSTRLMYQSIISIFKFEKRWNLINLCRDIKIPTCEETFKNTISLNEFYIVKDKICNKKWIKKRNWMIFCFMFFTGVRVSELLQFNKKNIINNILIVNGKGSKSRNIYIVNYLNDLISKWNHNKIAINKYNKLITSKQINTIIKKISLKYFNKELTSHGLRRSFATNLLRNNINLEIARKTLGHTNINTTSKYLHYNDEEIFNELKKVFN